MSLLTTHPHASRWYGIFFPVAPQTPEPFYEFSIYAASGPDAQRGVVLWLSTGNNLQTRLVSGPGNAAQQFVRFRTVHGICDELEAALRAA